MLTNAHLAVLSALRSIRDKTGESPTQSELLEYLRNNEILPSATNYYIHPLEYGGYITVRGVIGKSGHAGKQLILTKKGEAAIEAITEVE
ncbi:MAG: hypothetical protein AB9866_18965 [Syntrophobacteraceae bacterium]